MRYLFSHIAINLSLDQIYKQSVAPLSIVQRIGLVSLGLILLYAFFDYVVWKDLAQFYSPSITSNWYLLIVTFSQNPLYPPVERVLAPSWNVPFMLFCVAIAENLYIIRNIQRSKNTNSTT